MLTPYGQSELHKGCKQVQGIFSRRLGSDAKQESEELTAALCLGADSWIVDRIDWLLNSTYGSEIHYYLFNQCEMWFSGKQSKNFDNALTSFAKTCVQVLVLLEYSELNINKVFKVLRTIPANVNEVILQGVRNEIINYFTTE